MTSLSRLFVFTAVLAGVALAFVLTVRSESAVVVTDAVALPMGSDATLFMVSLTMQNNGDPVALTSAEAPGDAELTLMNPDGDGPLVLPAGDQGLLAMDGAHLVLSLPEGGLEEGAFQPISLNFDDGTSVTARAMRPAPMAMMEMDGMDMDSMAMMDHGAGGGVMVDPAPSIVFSPAPTFGAEGGTATLAVENFDFVTVPDDAPHVAGEGHAHIYLNGLKLGRLYETSFQIGGLAPGSYELRVSLNTNDHRAYMQDGAPIEAVLAFDVP